MIKLLYVGLFLISFSNFADAKSRIREAYVYSERLSLWKKPGLTYKDCIGITNDEETMQTIASQGRLTPAQNANLPYCRVPLASQNQVPTGDDRVVIGGGERLLVVVDENGNPDHYPTFSDPRLNDDPTNWEYIRAEYSAEDPATGQITIHRGWVEKRHVGAVMEIEEQRENLVTGDDFSPRQSDSSFAEVAPEEDCDPVVVDQPLKLQRNAADILNHIGQNNNVLQTDLGTMKSPAELAHFACLYRDHRIPINTWRQEYPKFLRAAQAAEESTKIPKEITMCKALVESGAYYNPNETDEYKGIGQFGSAIIDDLGKDISRGGSRQTMWSEYQNLTQSRWNTRARFTDSHIRSNSDPTHSMGAIALMLRWIYDERLPAVGCSECSTDLRFNRRDLYMMIAGYNWGPYSLSKIKDKTLWGMRHTYPPPKETRRYIVGMERCIEAGKFDRFRVQADDTKQSLEYRNTARRAECDQHFPLR